MSIALERNGGDAIRRSRHVHGMPFNSIYDSQEPKVFAGDGRLEQDLDSCSSTSIGRNSDLSGGSSDGEDSTDDEVQSSYKGGPLDTMDALEQVLPVKYDYGRGISSFYSGKSKSFTSLADASTASSIKDLAKPENPYNRKRKNLLARANLLDKNRNCPLKNNGGGISKRAANSNRSSYLVGETLSSSGYSSNREDSSSSISTSPSCCLPPLHPHGKRSPENRSSSPPERQSPWRSFSLSDLQCVAAASTPNITGLAISSGDEDN